jgi:hypothetical protein
MIKKLAQRNAIFKKPRGKRDRHRDRGNDEKKEKLY